MRECELPWQVVGTDPVLMLSGPIPATEQLLARAGLSIGDIGLYEVNEAFACVALAWCKQLGADRILQCYARRFENVRRSKLALADKNGTAAYYHTTVIDLQGLNTSFLRKENRSFIKRTFQFSSKCYPETVFRILKHYNKMKQPVPMILVKMYAYQAETLLVKFLSKRRASACRKLSARSPSM